MRHLIGIFFIISTSLFGFQGVHIITAGTNLGTAFSGTFPQLALTLVSPAKGLYVFNGAATPIAISCSQSAAAVPATSTTTNPMQFFVGPSNADGVILPAGCGKRIYLRASGASIVSGNILLSAF